MKRGLYLLSIGLVFAACTKEKDGAVPECIQERLATFANGEACSSGATLERFTFQGNMVYVFDPGNCGADMEREVRSEDCAVLGYLDGISGNQEINGIDFDSNASLEGRVWAN